MIKHVIGTVIDIGMIEEIVTEIAEVTGTEIVNAHEIRLVTVSQKVTECVTLSLQKKNEKIRVKATQMGLKKQMNNFSPGKKESNLFPCNLTHTLCT